VQKTDDLIRRQLSRKLDQLQPLRQLNPPAKGWISEIRRALGMTAKQLANRLEVSQPAVSQYEKNEVSGSITLTTLRNAAEALECDLVYALLPKRGLEETRAAQAHRVAERVVRSVAHSMNLERQVVSEEEIRQQIQDLGRQILDENPRGLWNQP